MNITRRLLPVACFLLACQCVKQESPATHPRAEASNRPSASDRRAPSAAHPAPPVPADVKPAAPRREGQPPVQPADSVISLSPAPDTGAPPPTALAASTDLFTSQPQARIMAEDFKIGELQDGVTASRDSLQALSCVRKFMDGLVAKNVDYSLILPAVQRELKAVISYPLKQGYMPQRYRVGKMAFEQEDELRANIRLYKDDGVTEGEIYLKKTDDVWRIADLQVGFTLLARTYKKPAEPFVPGDYSFLLED
jgi:hypothetical protein